MAGEVLPSRSAHTARALGSCALASGLSKLADRSHQIGDHTMRLNLQLRRPARDTGISRRAQRRKPNLEMLEGRQLLSGGMHDVLDIGDVSDNSVKQFDAQTGAYMGTLVAPGSGGLDGPRGVIDRNNGQLLVVNQNVDLSTNGEIDRYNAKTGAVLSPLVPASDPNAPFAPRGMVVKDNVVYVANLQDNTDSTANGEIKEYKASNGKFLGNLFPTGLPGKFNPRAVVFGPDGNLYVSAFDTANPLVGDILKFNTTTGSYRVVAFNNGDGVADKGETQDLHRPEGLTFGPDGNLYVTSFRANATDTDKILVLNGRTGHLQNEINLDSAGGDRAFAQAILFGPEGDSVRAHLGERTGHGGRAPLRRDHRYLHELRRARRPAWKPMVPDLRQDRSGHTGLRTQAWR